MEHEVYVTGMGVLNAIAEDVESFSESLETGRCGVTGEIGDGLGIAARIPDKAFADRLAAHELSDSRLMRVRRTANRATRSVRISLLTALEAWKDAALEGADVHLDDMHLIVAGHNLGAADQFRMFEKFRDHPEYIPARYALQFMDTDHIGVLSESLEIHGEGYTVGGASASGNSGLIQAYRQIRLGGYRVCVVVGAMADLSPVELQAFRHIGAMAGERFAGEPEKASRPFDAEHEGFVYGQGSACLILESAESARERGAAAWGRIAGGAICLDANRLSNPIAHGEARAMKKALADARVAPADVDYINAHGTSSVSGDEIEIEALNAVFGPLLQNTWVNATKGLTGHCLYAAGLVEAVAVLIQLKRGFVHPNRNLENPIDKNCRFAASTG